MSLNKIRWIWTLITGLLILPIIILFIYIFRPFNRVVRKTCRILFWINGFNVKKIGEFDNTADLIVLNHQGVIDIMYLEAYYPRDLCWIAKKELGDIFLYGHALKAPRMILIDREDKKSLVFLLKEVKNKLEKGRVIAIFPEGTRSNGDKDLLPFKNGAKVLIEKYNLKIQPIVLIGTRKLFDHSKFRVDSSNALAVCLKAFTPDFNDKNWYEKLRDTMQKTYQQYYN